MIPWVIDANEMEASQVSVFKTNLLHPTRRIERFLESSNSTTTIVVGPKGYGKTLLLKAKRLSLDNGSLKILPSGQALLDKPSGTPTPPPSKEYSDIRDNPGYWKSLWTIAISVAILKSENIVTDKISPLMDRIFSDHALSSSCDIFDAILSASYSEYQYALGNYNDIFVPRIRAIHHSISLFIDTIDEYYEEMLRAHTKNVGINFYGEASAEYWYLAQLGIALASREITGLNPHIRVYASIRREVLQRGLTSTSFGQQLDGRSIKIEYRDADLRAMIERNIANEDDNFVDKRSSDLVAAFIGKESTTIFHPKTGDQESFVDFWIRHSLRRPRDIISIGKRISELEPSERNSRNLRQEVRRGSCEIAHSYMGEMEPHLSGFDPEIIIELIPSNTLSRAQLGMISERYAEMYRSTHGTVGAHSCHVFCALYKIGLLGYVVADIDSRERVQSFVVPGNLALDEVGVLPDADIYLIHPILDELIASRTPKYLSNLNALNVIGPGRPWRDERSISYVLKGDLKGFSEIMKDVPKAKRFDEMLRSAAAEYCGGIEYPNIKEGDSILLIDTNPVSVITAARQIEDRMAHSEFRGSFRFGGEAGYVLIDGNSGDRSVSGMAIRTAARLEPHVTPGEIWVTEEFVNRVREQFSADMYRFEKIEADDAPALEIREGRFNLAKNERDETILTQIYRVRPL